MNEPVHLLDRHNKNEIPSPYVVKYPPKFSLHFFCDSALKDRPYRGEQLKAECEPDLQYSFFRATSSNISLLDKYELHSCYAQVARKNCNV